MTNYSPNGFSVFGACFQRAVIPPQACIHRTEIERIFVEPWALNWLLRGWENVPAILTTATEGWSFLWWTSLLSKSVNSLVQPGTRHGKWPQLGSGLALFPPFGPLDFAFLNLDLDLDLDLDLALKPGKGEKWKSMLDSLTSNHVKNAPRHVKHRSKITSECEYQQTLRNETIYALSKFEKHRWISVACLGKQRT